MTEAIRRLENDLALLKSDAPRSQGVCECLELACATSLQGLDQVSASSFKEPAAPLMNVIISLPQRCGRSPAKLIEL